MKDAEELKVSEAKDAEAVKEYINGGQKRIKQTGKEASKGPGVTMEQTDKEATMGASISEIGTKGAAITSKKEITRDATVTRRSESNADGNVARDVGIEGKGKKAQRKQEVVSWFGKVVSLLFESNEENIVVLKSICSAIDGQP